jgi:hypothetical protein
MMSFAWMMWRMLFTTDISTCVVSQTIKQFVAKGKETSGSVILQFLKEL